MKQIILLIFAVTVMTACGSKEEQKQSADNTPKQETVTTQEIETPKVAKIIDFSATWCGPCRQMIPVIEEISKKYEGIVEIEKIDIDENRQMAEKYAVESIPTLVYLDAFGNEIDRSVGYKDAKEVDAYILGKK